MVPFLGPGVGKKHERPADGGLGQRRDKLPRVVVENADIGEVVFFNSAQQAGDAVDEGLAADKTDAGMCLGQFGQMFAAAETDLEPDVGNGIGKGRRQVQAAAFGRRIQPQARQQVFDQGLAAGAQLVAAAAAV